MGGALHYMTAFCSTSHADGSLKFWDASAATLQVLYKLKTAKLFDKSKCRSADPNDDLFIVQHIHFCTESRVLCVAGLTHVIVFRFCKQDTSTECQVSVLCLFDRACMQLWCGSGQATNACCRSTLAGDRDVAGVRDL